MQLNTPRSPHRTTSDNVYYVRFWVGFCLGNGWFLSFVKFGADEPDQFAWAMLNDISGGRPLLIAAMLSAGQARCSPVGRSRLTALSCRRGQAWLAGRIVTSVQVLDMCLLYVTKAF